MGDLVNLKSAARRLGVHYQTAYRWVRSGQLVAVKVGAGYEISDAALARFEAQRAAVERAAESVPDESPTAVSPGAVTRSGALAALDTMLDAVSLNVDPFLERATRLTVAVVGDGALLTLPNEDGELGVVHVAHLAPHVELRMGWVARAEPYTKQFARMVASSGKSVFVPQVPQQQVRDSVGPEVHEYLVKGSCFSVICVPIFGDDAAGALFLMRDEAGRPYTPDDVAFAEAVATRIALARTQTTRQQSAWNMRRRVVDALAEAACRHESVDELGCSLDKIVKWTVGDDTRAAVAVLDLELRQRVCTKPYAELLGRDPASVRGALLPNLVADADQLYRGLERLLKSEVDFRSFEIATQTTSSPVLLHCAMARRPDATPWAIVITAHAAVKAVKA